MLAVAAAFSFGLQALAQTKPPPVIVVTIKPLHSLVAGVTKGLTEPKLLLASEASAHTYALRPSDSAALQSAQVIVRVSPNLETFLTGPIETLAGKARVVSMSAVPGITALPVRDAGGAGQGAVPEGAAFIDPHLWLDPGNAKALVLETVRVLSALDPAHAAIYGANADAVAARLDQLDADLRTAFAGLQAKPFVTFHDVTQYLERRYGLHASAIAFSPERQPSAARIAAVRERIAALGAPCVFAEPQFPPKLIETVTEGTGAKLGALDETGSTIAPGPDHYFLFMEKVAASLKECLSR